MSSALDGYKLQLISTRNQEWTAWSFESKIDVPTYVEDSYTDIDRSTPFDFALNYSNAGNALVLQSSVGESLIFASLNFKPGTYGKAILKVSDFSGDEVVYTRGEASSENSKGLLRWKGQRVFSASTNTSWISRDNARFAGNAHIFKGAIKKLSGTFGFKEDFKALWLTGTVNDMLLKTSYDFNENWLGSKMMIQFVGWKGHEAFFFGLDTERSNISATMRLLGHKVLSFSASFPNSFSGFENHVSSRRLMPTPGDLSYSYDIVDNTYFRKVTAM